VSEKDGGNVAQLEGELRGLTLAMQERSQSLEVVTHGMGSTIELEMWFCSIQTLPCGLFLRYVS